jgi:hypothetical protein
MAEQRPQLPATQVGRVCSPVSAGPTISVEKVSLLCNSLLGTCSQALQLRLSIKQRCSGILRHGSAQDVEYRILRTAPRRTRNTAF